MMTNRAWTGDGNLCSKLVTFTETFQVRSSPFVDQYFLQVLKPSAPMSDNARHNGSFQLAPSRILLVLHMKMYAFR